MITELLDALRTKPTHFRSDRAALAVLEIADDSRIHFNRDREAIILG
jgi:hypothetical protein